MFRFRSRRFKTGSSGRRGRLASPTPVGVRRPALGFDLRRPRRAVASSLRFGFGAKPHKKSRGLRKGSRSRLDRAVSGPAFRFPRFKNVVRPFLEHVTEDLHQVPAVELFKKTPAGQSICSRRGERREVLFAGRIAGFRGRSPGRGGSYKRTPESTTVCRR